MRSLFIPDRRGVHDQATVSRQGEGGGHPNHRLQGHFPGADRKLSPHRLAVGKADHALGIETIEMTAVEPSCLDAKAGKFGDFASLSCRSQSR